MATHKRYMKKNVRVMTIYVTRAQRDKLQKLAKSKNVSMSTIIRQFIDDDMRAHGLHPALADDDYLDA